MCATYCQVVNPFKHIQTIFFIIPTPNILPSIRAPKVNRSNPKSGFLESVGLILQRLLGISITFGLRGCGGAWLQKKRFQTVLRQDFRCFKVQVSRFTVFRASNVPEFQGLIVSSCTVKGFQVPKAAAPSGVGITVRNVLEFLEFFFQRELLRRILKELGRASPSGSFQRTSLRFFQQTSSPGFCCSKGTSTGDFFEGTSTGQNFQVQSGCWGVRIGLFLCGSVDTEVNGKNDRKNYRTWVLVHFC